MGNTERGLPKSEISSLDEKRRILQSAINDLNDKVTRMLNNPGYGDWVNFRYYNMFKQKYTEAVNFGLFSQTTEQRIFNVLLNRPSSSDSLQETTLKSLHTLFVFAANKSLDDCLLYLNERMPSGNVSRESYSNIEEVIKHIDAYQPISQSVNLNNEAWKEITEKVGTIKQYLPNAQMMAYKRTMGESAILGAKFLHSTIHNNDYLDQSDLLRYVALKECILGVLPTLSENEKRSFRDLAQNKVSQPQPHTTINNVYQLNINNWRDVDLIDAIIVCIGLCDFLRLPTDQLKAEFIAATNNNKQTY